MAIEKTNRINALFEFYEPLLTEKQMTYIALYYRDDYSLGEIAENYDVSRQAVYDNIRRTEKILEEYEQKLHLYATFAKQSEKIDKIYEYVQVKYPKDQDLLDLIEELENLEDES
jgi:predicted DNA-binding protein YlxM (UPF0122 family)